MKVEGNRTRPEPTAGSAPPSCSAQRPRSQGYGDARDTTSITTRCHTGPARRDHADDIANARPYMRRVTIGVNTRHPPKFRIAGQAQSKPRG